MTPAEMFESRCRQAIGRMYEWTVKEARIARDNPEGMTVVLTDGTTISLLVTPPKP